MADYIYDLIKQTRSRVVSATPQDEKSAPQPPHQIPAPQGAVQIALPAADALALAPLDFRQLVKDRRSLRRYAEKDLSLEELSYLLWMTQGVKEITKRPVTLRTVPSAGSRHAFETYLLIQHVDGFAPGLYRYLAVEHTLILIDGSAEIYERINEACYDQRQVTLSAVTFLWVAVSERMTWRYVERGFRYLLLDAGHVCQNLYLAAESIACGVCAIAAFDDESLNDALQVDGLAQWAIYAATVGKR